MNTAPNDDRVLLAATETFAEHGYASATVRQIANRCGLSTGSIFHKFASKRDLLVAAVREGTIRTYASVNERLAGVTDPAERLRVLVIAHLESMHGASRPFMVVATREFHLLDESELESVVSVRDAYEKIWQEVIDGAAAAGLIATDPLMRLFLLGAVNQTFFWYNPAAGLSITDLGTRFADLVMLPGSQVHHPPLTTRNPS